MPDQMIRAFTVTVMSVEGDVRDIEGLEYQSKLWLILGWQFSEDKKVKRPRRLLRFDNLRHGKHEGEPGGYMINVPILEIVLTMKSKEGHETLDANELPFSIPVTLMLQDMACPHCSELLGPRISITGGGDEPFAYCPHCQKKVLLERIPSPAGTPVLLRVVKP